MVFGASNNENNKNEKKEDNLAKALRNKIVINYNSFYAYTLDRKYD